MDREAWHAAVHGAARSWTWLSNWTELNWWRGDEYVAEKTYLEAVNKIVIFLIFKIDIWG